MVAQAALPVEGETAAAKQETAQNGNLLSEVFGDRKERTLAGNIIGSVRDVFSGQLTESEKVKRAEGNDFVATIAADTAAMMSKKMMMGGVVRATMLADTKGNARDFALGFAKDGLEGVGLNAIGKMAQPGSRMYTSLGRQFGNGLKQEVALHATTGAMFGALKAGSDPNSWRDKEGHFSFQSGMNNLADWKKMGTATIAGAAINVPAGMLGFRIAKSSTLSVATRTGSESLGMVTGGVLSGGGSGAVFGGLDAVVHGKSLKEIGQSTLDGMWIGAATGGAMTGYHAMQSRFRPLVKPTEGQAQTGESQLKPNEGQAKVADISEQTGKPADKSVPAPKDAPEMLETSREKLTNQFEAVLSEEALAKMFAAHDQIAYKPEAKLGVGELSRQLTVKPSTEMRLIRVKKDVDLPKEFENISEFLKYTEYVNEPTRVLEVQGTPTKIKIPEEYARKLDKVREIRFWAEQPSPSFDSLPMGQRAVLQNEMRAGRMDLPTKVFGEKAETIAKIVNARLEMAKPENRRALPEDFVQAVKALPDPGLVKELILLDEPYYRDSYKNSKEKQSGPAAANASEDGKITFFEADNTVEKGSTSKSRIYEFLAHEWAHLVKFKLREHSALFNETAELESSRTDLSKIGVKLDDATVGKDSTEPVDTAWYVREYAKKQYPESPELRHHENFAVHLGEQLMMPDADNFFTTAHNAPIRTALMGRAWLEAIFTAGKEVKPQPRSITQTRAVGDPPEVREYVVHPSDLLARIDQIPMNLPNREVQVARLKYIAEEVVPIAREKLLDELMTGSLENRKRAAMLLGRIADPSDVDAMQFVMDLTKDQKLRQSLFDSMAHISHGDTDARLNFLIHEAQLDKPNREEALRAMQGLQHLDAQFYHKVLKSIDSNKNLPELMHALETVPLPGAKEMAFQHILRLAETSPYREAFLQTFLMSTLQKHPSLRVHALNEVLKHPSFALEQEAQRLMRSADTAVSSTARDVVAQLRPWKAIESAKRGLDSGDPQRMYDGIQELAWANDNRAIPVLLDVVASGQTKWVNQAVEALKHYSPNVIAVYAHEAQRAGKPIRWSEIQHQMALR